MGSQSCGVLPGAPEPLRGCSTIAEYSTTPSAVDEVPSALSPQLTGLGCITAKLTQANPPRRRRRCVGCLLCRRPQPARPPKACAELRSSVLQAFGQGSDSRAARSELSPLGQAQITKRCAHAPPGIVWPTIAARSRSAASRRSSPRTPLAEREGFAGQLAASRVVPGQSLLRLQSRASDREQPGSNGAKREVVRSEPRSADRAISASWRGVDAVFDPPDRRSGQQAGDLRPQPSTSSLAGVYFRHAQPCVLHIDGLRHGRAQQDRDTVSALPAGGVAANIRAILGIARKFTLVLP